MSATHRPSVSWTIASPLTSSARDVLADYLDCRFTDENKPRAGMQVAPDVQLLVVPEEQSCTVVAHFQPCRADLPATQQGWLHEWVVKAATMAGMPEPTKPKVVHVGPERGRWRHA